MDLGLRNKVAIVTGASSGIGRATAKALATEGCRVIAVARRTTLLETLVAELRAEGLTAPMAVTADLTDSSRAKGLVETAVSAFGRVDILVNNAGSSIPLDDPLEEQLDVWTREMGLQFDTVRRLSEAAMPQMRDHGWGRVINIGGILEPREVNVSTIAKAAMLTWSKGMSLTAGAWGITVNVIIPGFILTEQHLRRFPDPAEREARARTLVPMGKYGDPGEVGRAVAFLASEHAGFITGSVLHVDGGSHRYAF